MESRPPESELKDAALANKSEEQPLGLDERGYNMSYAVTPLSFNSDEPHSSVAGDLTPQHTR